MIKTDARVDKYINSAPEFAKPLLTHFRELVHKACPDVEETIKWGWPVFMYKGILCSVTAFKHHCSINFWKASLMKDTEKIFVEPGGNGMGQMGKLTGLEQLPSDKVMLAYLKEAVKINDDGTKVIRRKPDPDRKVEVPEVFIKVLKKNKKAKEVFDKFSYSNKKEYIDWIFNTKSESTRDKRIETAIEWIAEGKTRMWKYQKK